MALPAAERPKFCFDFGPPGVPPKPGYTKATPEVRHDPGSLNPNLGWQVGDVVRAYDYGGDPLFRDFCASGDATFRIDLPDGAYYVTVTSFDSRYDHGWQEFSFNGEVVSTAGASHTTPTRFTTWYEVAGGVLRLRIRDPRGLGADVVLNALGVCPTDDPKPIPPTPWESARDAWEGNMVAKGGPVAQLILKQTPGAVDSFGDTFYDADGSSTRSPTTRKI
jgi:hypothetical protein